MRRPDLTGASVAALVLIVCSAGVAAVLVPTATAQSTVNVTIDSFAFNPVNITVVIGVNNTETWTNQQSGVPHTVTSNDGTWGSGTLSTGGTFTHTFLTPGTFGYHCSIHTYMKATVTVIGSGSATTTTTTTTTTASTAPVTTGSTTAAQTTATSTPSRSGGVPGFPYSAAAVFAVSVLVAAAYLLARRPKFRVGEGSAHALA